MSVVGPIEVLFVVFLSTGFRSPLSPLYGFITAFLILCVSLWRSTDELEDPFANINEERSECWRRLYVWNDQEQKLCHYFSI